MLGLFTDDFFPYLGGIGRYVHELTSRLPQNRVIIFSPCRNDIDNHVRISPPLHKKLYNLSFSWWLHNNVNRVINRHALSRINIQCGPGGLFLLRKPDVPVIATCHHTWWQQSIFIQSQWWKKIFIPFERRTYKLSDLIICDSEASASVLKQRYGIHPEKIIVIPIGMDMDKFYPMPGVNKLEKSLFFVGRLEKRKGIDFLVKTMELVTRKMPEARLFVGGQGKGFSGLSQYIAKHGLKDNIIFLGFIPDSELNGWYNRVQCVVVPSIFEGFGLTAVEAMAAGTGVIVTSDPSLAAIVDDQENGFVIPYGDRNALSNRILLMLENTEIQKKISQKALLKVKTHYNWDTIIPRYMDALYGVV
ncbi:MAG: glycosyltransferase family 4 protein [Deltaproteobacteria bacterium]|nr:glycosyltransferase family 4 protein [Deltaproteobacteria bacterium]